MILERRVMLRHIRYGQFCVYLANIYNPLPCLNHNKNNKKGTHIERYICHACILLIDYKTDQNTEVLTPQPVKLTLTKPYG